MFGRTGFHLPPIVLGTAALGNACRVITEQAKAEIVAEWFRQLRPPVFVEAAYDHGRGMAIEVLGRALQRLEIAGDEIVVQLAAGRTLPNDWEKICRLLGPAYQPKLIMVRPDDADNLRAAQELKAVGKVRGVGLLVSSTKLETEAVASPEPLASALEEVDWWAIHGGCTVMRRSPKTLEFLTKMARRQIPVIAAGVFEGGFLVGGSKLDGRSLQIDNASDRSLLAWRKSFVALCDGHGISPAHACVQFALALPAVAAVRVESTYVDRTVENIRSTFLKAPDNFWTSMKEEGLLEADYPFLG